ncbi:hypothetical protein DMY87_12605 [Rhizobium wuzhouense]|uniref:Uncharacterized protein n=1 Tax=Rhizobium wuzhouense TaxID=1986026 RepID=A0ABX5NSW7_9HYPH|nr:hypothetical protein DMY87_12605 [Rhizobium wuzhouense]
MMTASFVFDLARQTALKVTDVKYSLAPQDQCDKPPCGSSTHQMFLICTLQFPDRSRNKDGAGLIPRRAIYRA